jgi:MYXO-CTERM domain-containing protein
MIRLGAGSAATAFALAIFPATALHAQAFFGFNGCSAFATVFDARGTVVAQQVSGYQGVSGTTGATVCGTMANAMAGGGSASGTVIGGLGSLGVSAGAAPGPGSASGSAGATFFEVVTATKPGVPAGTLIPVTVSLTLAGTLSSLTGSQGNGVLDLDYVNPTFGDIAISGHTGNNLEVVLPSALNDSGTAQVKAGAQIQMIYSIGAGATAGVVDAIDTLTPHLDPGPGVVVTTMSGFNYATNATQPVTPPVTPSDPTATPAPPSLWLTAAGLAAVGFFFAGRRRRMI